MSIALADGTNVQISGVGTAILNLLVNEKNVRTDLHNIYYCSELDSNLIFLEILEKNECFFTVSKGRLRVFNPNSETALKTKRIDTLYIINLVSESYIEGIRANKTVTINL